MRDRSFRRHKFAVMKERAKSRVKQLYSHLINQDYDRIVGIHTHTKTLCSCEVCGNQRRFHGEPVREKKDSTKYPED